MERIRLDEDVQPVSEFRQNAARFVQQVRETRRPLVLTQHGKSAAVLLDVEEYERLLDQIDVVRSVAEGLAEIQRGEAMPHEEVVARLASEFGFNLPAAADSPADGPT